MSISTKSNSSTRTLGHTCRPQTITQAELRKLPELDRAAKGRESLRKSIIRRMEAGAGVEPGDLSASIDLKPVDQPSWHSLKACLDPDVYAHIRKVYRAPSFRFLHINASNGDVLR